MPKRRTKIVCTIGPASQSPQVMRGLIQAGMNVARLNFSHGSHQDHARTVSTLRSVSAELGTRVAILQDLSGPKMRIGTIAGDEAELKARQRFTLTSRDIPGDGRAVSVNTPELIESLEPDDRILLADGELELRVRKVAGGEAECEVVAGGLLRSKKGITAPGVKLRRTVPTEKDLTDLEFGIAQEVDWVAQSFVRTPEELQRLKSIIRDRKADIPVIVKLEKREAAERFREIIDAADGVMVARGDLGLEVGLKEIPYLQKQIIRYATQVGKPDITATQMLESMIANPRPTRAEATDIANAVFDGTDAVMLSGETAIGKYPVEACRTMAEIAAAAEEHIDYVEQFRTNPLIPGADIQEAIGHAASDTALRIGASMIICCTRSGKTAATVAKYRPHARIAVASPFEKTLLRTILFWGTRPIKMELAHDTDRMIDEAKQAVLKAGPAQKGEKVVIVAGIPIDEPGTTNMIKADVL